MLRLLAASQHSFSISSSVTDFIQWGTRYRHVTKFWPERCKLKFCVGICEKADKRKLNPLGDKVFLFCPSLFVFPTFQKGDMMARLPAAILGHEVTMKVGNHRARWRVKQKYGKNLDHDQHEATTSACTCRFLTSAWNEKNSYLI